MDSAEELRAQLRQAQSTIASQARTIETLAEILAQQSAEDPGGEESPPESGYLNRRN